MTSGLLLAPAPGVHDDQAGAGIDSNPGDRGLTLQAPDVVDDMRAGRDREPRRFLAIRIDRDQHAVPGKRLDHRQHTALLFGGGNRDRRGPGEFAADVDDGRALLDHAAGLRDRLRERREMPAIGEAVRGDVEDADDQRLRPELDFPAVREAPSPRCERQHFHGRRLCGVRRKNATLFASYVTAPAFWLRACCAPRRLPPARS